MTDALAEYRRRKAEEIMAFNRAMELPRISRSERYKRRIRGMRAELDSIYELLADLEPHLPDGLRQTVALKVAIKKYRDGLRVRLVSNAA